MLTLILVLALIVSGSVIFYKSHIVIFYTVFILSAAQISSYIAYALLLLYAVWYWGLMSSGAVFTLNYKFLSMINILCILRFIKPQLNCNLTPTLYAVTVGNIGSIIRGYLKQLFDLNKYLLKKYVYTINHKRIAINYLVFTMWSTLAGATLATMIR